MEIASLARYSFIKYGFDLKGNDRLLYFFMPCEELDGGSPFSKLSENYKIVQKYVEKIDSKFI